MILLIFVSLLSFILVIYYFPYLLRKISEFQLLSKCRHEGILVLTFDDGPGEKLTPKILDLLNKYKVKATFFLLGHKVNRYPDLVRKIQLFGHEIGSHSQNHLNAWKSWPWKAVKDVNAGFKSINNILDNNPPFRPPNGKIIFPIWLMIKLHKTYLGWWTFDSGDTHEILPSINDVVELLEKQGGGVVLLHDFDRVNTEAKEREEFVVELTEALLKLASKKMWKIKPYSYLMCK